MILQEILTLLHRFCVFDTILKTSGACKDCFLQPAKCSMQYSLSSAKHWLRSHCFGLLYLTTENSSASLPIELALTTFWAWTTLATEATRTIDFIMIRLVRAAVSDRDLGLLLFQKSRKYHKINASATNQKQSDGMMRFMDGMERDLWIENDIYFGMENGVTKI